MRGNVRGVAPAAAAVLLVSLALAGPLVAADGSAAPVTVLVSRAGGDGRGGDGNSLTPTISADGRYIAFTSRARNLDPAAPSGGLEIYLRDTVAKTTTLVSRASGASGAAADGDSGGPTISADGRYVAFHSSAGNLSPEDVAPDDVYLRDTVAKTTTLVSRASGASGAAADGESFAAAISADGRHVAFESQANNLSSADKDENSYDIFVRDLDTGLTELVSRAGGPDGAGGSDTSYEPTISGDGSRVAFFSRAPLTADDRDGENFPGDVFVRDRTASTTTLVSRATGADGAPSEVESQDPAISADGRYVAFVSDAKLTGQRGFERNVFVRDLAAATTALATVGDVDNRGRPERHPSISADGRYVAFQSAGNHLTQVDSPNRMDVFVRDMQLGLTVDASRASGELGVPGDGPSFDPSISADGAFVAFDSRATNLSGADQDKFSDVFLRRPVYAKEAPLPKCAGRTATIIGSGRSETLTGTKRSDVVLALGGDDRVSGLTGADAICAGPGRDRVEAGPNGGNGGFDLVLGGPGADRLSLGPELGTLKGGAGNDVLIGSKGGDNLYGGPGNDLLRGGPNPHYNSDFLFGGPGNDVLLGGPGPNSLRGGPGHNHLVGGNR
jgi:Tol biopolymer transport system component